MLKVVHAIARSRMLKGASVNNWYLLRGIRRPLLILQFPESHTAWHARCGRMLPRFYGLQTAMFNGIVRRSRTDYHPKNEFHIVMYLLSQNRYFE